MKRIELLNVRKSRFLASELHAFTMRSLKNAALTRDPQFSTLCGSTVWRLAHLEFELGDPGSNPGSRHYSIGWQPLASCLLTLPPQFLSSKKLGYKNGVFGA